MKRLIATISMALFLGGCPPETEDTDTTEPVNLEGATYRLSTGNLTVPGADQGMNDLLKLFFIRTLIIQFHNVTDSAATIRLAFVEENSDPLVQDPCMETIEFPEGTRDELTVEIGPTDVSFDGADVEDLHMTATVSTKGTRIDEIVIESVIDLRQAESFGFGTAQDLCESTEGYGVPCQKCDDNSKTCLDLTIEGLTANEAEVEIEVITSIPNSCND
ncbi:MAG: hypothetical protein HN348_00575 [Proteobacteria bacterium]|nr:hypothetical protein [Pseudomonadota bacterium]